MEMNRMIAMFMEYCKSKQLRERTMLSYEQSLKLFAVWLEDVEEITHVEKIKEMNIVIDSSVLISYKTMHVNDGK